MNNIMELLRSLPKERLRALDKFMRSPYHVTHAGVLELYTYLRAQMKHPAASPSLEAAGRELRTR